MRAIRGAVQVPANTVEALSSEVPTLVREMIEVNGLTFDSVVSILFTATPDITADFPAASARSLPLGDVPLICAQEIAVPNSMPRVVRVLMHVESTLARSEIQHVYLGATKSLRKDLAQ